MLGQCDSRDRFRDLFARLYDYPKFGLPAQHGEPGGVLRCARPSHSLWCCVPFVFDIYVTLFKKIVIVTYFS